MSNNARIEYRPRVMDIPNLHNVIHMVTHSNEQIEKPRDR